MIKRLVYGGFGIVALSLLIGSSNAQTPQWVGTWAASPMVAQGGFAVHPFAAVTLREIAHVSNGGQQVRVRFTNEFGLDGLTISNAHVALSAGGSAIKDGTDHPLTFDGASTVRIPPGAAMYSDPVALSVPALSDVAVSFFIPSQVMRAETYHGFADQDNFMVDGDQAAAATLSAATELHSWYFMDGIDVNAAEGARAIVAIGDSITDGAASTKNADLRWPDVLAARLKQEKGLENVSVLNEGIGGNRVLNDGAGVNILARLDRDVLAQTGVKYVIVLESINDIGGLARLSGPEAEINAQMLEGALKQLADLAHTHGIKAYGATLTPYGGAGYSSPKGEEIRKAVNDWIRTSGVFDGVVDFDKATEDPANPDHFNPAYDSGDHLHPSDAGYKAMGASIDLKLFK